MSERRVLIIGIVTIAVFVAGGMIFALLTGKPWLDALIAPSIATAAAAALGALIALGVLIMRRADPIWAAGGAVTVDDDHNLTLSTKRFLRAPEPTATVRLDQVTDATWYISPFSRSGTLSIQLWDHDPEITFGLFGLRPKSGTRPLAEISTRILHASPTATTRLQHYLEQRIYAGTLECNFTPHDFEPIPELRPPLEPGITFSTDGREIRYRKPDPDEMP